MWTTHCLGTPLEIAVARTSLQVLLTLPELENRNMDQQKPSQKICRKYPTLFMTGQANGYHAMRTFSWLEILAEHTMI